MQTTITNPTPNQYFRKAFHVEKKKQMKGFNLAMAMIAIGSMGLDEEEVNVLKLKGE